MRTHGNKDKGDPIEERSSGSAFHFKDTAGI